MSVEPPPTGLSEPWRRWVIASLRQGEAPAALVEALCEEGAPRALASLEVASIQATLAVLAEEERPARRLAQAARLVRDPREMPVLDIINTENLKKDYIDTNRPVLLPGLARDWPALHTWSPAALSTRFGDIPVRYCQGRDTDPQCDRHWRTLSVEAPFRAFLAAVESAPAGNDLYLISRNRALRETGLGAMLEDCRPLPPMLDPAALRAGASLWIGPAGTVTPTHHDQHDALFVQIRGRKRLRLVSPREPALMREIDQVYSPFDPEAPDPARLPGCDATTVLDVILHPGDAALLPAGWWHHVRALDLSISLSLTGFRWPNDATWYAPGAL